MTVILSNAPFTSFYDPLRLDKGERFRQHNLFNEMAHSTMKSLEAGLRASHMSILFNSYQVGYKTNENNFTPSIIL